jgi:hypothetical protein
MKSVSRLRKQIKRFFVSAPDPFDNRWLQFQKQLAKKLSEKKEKERKKLKERYPYMDLHRRVDRKKETNIERKRHKFEKERKKYVITFQTF